MAMMVVSLVAVVFMFCVQLAVSLGGEPSCPAGLYEQKLLEYAIESNAMLKTLGEKVGKLSGASGVDDGGVREQLKNLSKEVNVLKERIDGLQTLSDRGNKGKDSIPVVAFSAVLNGSISQIGAKNVLKLDRVISNIGGHFNTTTGTFTAPLDGLYHFSATLMAGNNAEIWGYINTPTDRIKLYARGTDDRHDQGSQTVITELKSGDMVALHGGPLVYGQCWSSFSGFLIR